jgi:hypothetical protein
VAGNHEFYDHDWAQTRVDLQRACAGSAVTVLDEGGIEVQGTRILGCTMWTDFQLPGSTLVQAMQTVEQGLTDYRVIRTAQGPLRTAQILADHERSRRWLAQQLALPFDGATVVVTHHAPHPLSIHARFAGHPINAGFVSDLTPCWPMPTCGCTGTPTTASTTASGAAAWWPTRPATCCSGLGATTPSWRTRRSTRGGSLNCESAAWPGSRWGGLRRSADRRRPSSNGAANRCDLSVCCGGRVRLGCPAALMSPAPGCARRSSLYFAPQGTPIARSGMPGGVPSLGAPNRVVGRGQWVPGAAK